MSRNLPLVTIVVAALALVGCGRQSASLENYVAHKPARETIEQLAARRIVFAHQSVGNDILKGVDKLAAEAGVPISIVETREPPESGSGIHHFKVGENGVPKAKLDDFLATLTAKDFSNTDVALVKLCYIDFTESTDPTRLATQYLDVLDSLRAKYPGTRFVAATAPLTTIQTGPKAWIKKVLGKEPAGYEANARRQAFNDAIRSKAAPGTLFDIAKVESSLGGSATSFEHDGKRIEALNPALTYDGGHLNDKGKALAAAAFIELFAAPATDNSEHPAGS